MAKPKRSVTKRSGTRRSVAKRPATKRATSDSSGETRRLNRHSDPGRQLPSVNEDDLVGIIENLTVPPFLLILDQVQDPHNLGACLRSAEAAGIHAVIAPKDRSSGITDTVRRVACGGAENVPFIQVTNLSRTIEMLKENKIWLTGTTDRAEKSIFECDLTGPTAIVMGSEGSGLRRLTAEKCDFLAQIPMAGHVECLNVSVATGVVLFEALRQRTLVK